MARLTVFDVAAERRLLRKQVTGGDALARLWPRAFAQSWCQPKQPPQPPLVVKRPQPRLPSGKVSLIPLALRAIEPCDQLQGDPRKLLVLALRPNRPAARVRLVSNPDNLRAGPRVCSLCFIAVGLKHAGKALDQRVSWLCRRLVPQP